MPDLSTARRQALHKATLSAVLGVTIVAAAALPALAGPPLLCHPFDIGGARSLPWDGSSSWFDGRDDYDLSNLVRETEGLLTADTPVIVRMETLRRAAIYASQDSEVVTQLVKMLEVRVSEASDKEQQARAMALFDAAYAIEATRQLSMVSQFKARRADLERLVEGKDGYAMVKRTLQLRPNDASLEFAAALFAASRDRATHGTAYAEHARRARAGASKDALLARNIGQLS